MTFSNFYYKKLFNFFFTGKSVSPDMIKRRAAKCGDGTHYLSHENVHKDAVWGFGDDDIHPDDQIELKKMEN